MSDIFQQASQQKVRFSFSGGIQTISKPGNLNVEDLWDLALEDLDRIALDLDAQIRTAPTKSFINEAAQSTKEHQTLTLKLEILVAIIKVKKELKAAKIERAQQSQQRERILNAIADKEAKALDNLSLDELKAMLPS